jgi:hypothetical protein
MTTPMTPEIHGALIAHADDVSHDLIDKWGGAVVGDPKYTVELDWHIEVTGLLDDIPMTVVRIYADGFQAVIV